MDAKSPGDEGALRRRIAALEVELEAMVERNAMLAPLLEAIPAVVMRVGLDARIEFINRVLPEYEGSTLIGRTIYDFAPPDQHGLIRTAFEHAIEHRKSTVVESLAEAPDGTRDVYSSTFGPILDGDRLVGLVVVSVNVSRARAAELALIDREARLRLALEAGNVGIWRWDIATDAVQWDDNLCAIFGIAPEAAPQTRSAFIAMVSSDQRAALEAHISRAVVTGEYPDFELRSDGPAGPSWFIIKGGAIHDQGGRVAGLMGGVIDDTERRRFAHRIAEAQKLEAVGQLAAGVAHNFNNALSSVVLALELAKNHLPPAESARMADALDAATHAAALVRDMLAFSRGRPIAPARREPCATVLRRAVELSQQTFDRRITVVATGLDAPALAAIDVNAAAIEQLVVNLMLNARDALDGVSGDRARIDVAVRLVAARQLGSRVRPEARGDYVEIVVQDRGCGMNAEAQRRCFEPFFTTKGIGKGTGLGLSTAWAAVEAEGGVIECHSTVGAGTTFSVYLPAVTQRVASPAPPSATPARRGAGRTVLVVDDDARVRRSCAAVLEYEGFVVLGAASGDEAVAVVERQPVDVVLLDHSMPGLSPEETLRRMRIHCPALPVVSHSGLDRTLEGATGYIAKPSRIDDIVASLTAALSSATP